MRSLQAARRARYRDVRRVICCFFVVIPAQAGIQAWASAYAEATLGQIQVVTDHWLVFYRASRDPKGGLGPEGDIAPSEL